MARSVTSRSSRRAKGVRKTASQSLAFIRTCSPTFTLSRELMKSNSRMFWNVRAIPSWAVR